MKNFKICDTHNDFLSSLELSQIKDYIKACKREGVEVVCASYWSSKKEKRKIMSELSLRSELLRSEEEDFLLHIEDLWWIENRNELEALLKLKPFSCSLTWNDKNALAGGTASKYGLSDFGKGCLEKLLEEGVTVDFAHLNCKSFYEVAEIAKQNLYCSHTGFRGVKNHKRNLTDSQIEKIVLSNGYIGLFFFDKCLQKAQNVRNKQFLIEDVVNSLVYFVKHFGSDNIGIGSDFYGIENYPKGLENYSDFPKLVFAMKEAGFSEEEIEKIFYLNFKNFLARKNIEVKKNDAR